MNAVKNGTATAPQFPCAAVPEATSHQRLLGLYNQRGGDLLMLRIKLIAGRPDLDQLARIADLAATFTPDFPLHLTTRQNIELHGVRPEDVPAVQRGLYEVGLTSVGSCGDSIRNVTVDPESGLAPGSFDLGPLAIGIHTHAQSFPGAFGLPRKFKISLSSSAAGTARPDFNDLGLIALEDGHFRVVVAGSLGGKPLAGIPAYDRISLDEILPLVTAALRLFEAEGDRENRSRARLRHARERLGDAKFLSLLDSLFREEKAHPCEPLPTPVRYPGPGRPRVRLNLPEGDIWPEDVHALVDLAQRHGASVRIGLEHDLAVFGIEQEELPERLRKWAKSAHVVACPGAQVCQRGVVDTAAPANALREALAGADLLAAVSGCPNGCSYTGVADIGLVGRLKTVNGGEQRPHYRLYAGGGRGCSPGLAVELHPAVPLERVGLAVQWLRQEWLAAQDGGWIPFSEFMAKSHERLSEGLNQFLETR